MSSKTPTLEDIGKEFEKHENNSQQQLTKIPKGFPTAIVFFTLYIIGLVWWFLNYPFFMIEEFQELVTLLLSFFETYEGILGSAIPSTGYISILALYVTIVVYFDVLFLLPWTYIFSVKTDPIEKIRTYFGLELKIFFIAFVPLLITAVFLGNSSSTIDSQSEMFKKEANSTITNFMERISCSFNANCVLSQKRNNVDSQESDREDYSIQIMKTYDDFYDYKTLQQRPLRISYKILSQGGGIFVEKLECYQDKILKNNLLDSIEINKKIETSDEAEEHYYDCDLSGIEMDSKIDEITIKPVLYFSLDSKYTQKIPIFDIDKYSEKYGLEKQDISLNDIKKIIEEREGKAVFIPSNDALDYEISLKPKMVILSNKDEFLNEIIFSATFKENDNYKYGKQYSSTLTNFEKPPSINLIPEMSISTPYQLLFHDGKSIIRIYMDASNTQIENELKTELLKFEITSKFKKDDSFRLTVDNPDWKPEEEETETIVNEGPSQSTDTPETSTSNSAQGETNEETSTQQQDDEWIAP